MISRIAIGIAALALFGACAKSSPRDARADSNNLFGAIAGVTSGGYEQFNANKRADMEAAIRRQRQIEQENYILRDGFSQSEARRRAVQDELARMQSKANQLELASARAASGSQQARERAASLDAQRIALDQRADALLAQPVVAEDTSGLERQLTTLQAEQALLLEEYEAIALQ